MKLNSQNPNALIYNTDEIEITVLGGVNCEHYDRLKVTLKLSNGSESLRQPVDLYNDELISKLVRKAAERLELPTADIYKAISELTEALEEYKFNSAQKDDKPKTKQLSKAEEKKAFVFLSSSNLMERTSDAIAKAGVIGEELNRLLMFICYTSRKRVKPLHVICLGSSGSGKTHLQEVVSSLIPSEECIEITALSENALYYFGETELRHKLLLIEDLDGAEDVLYPLRELQSKQKISKTIPMKDSRGNIQTTTIIVKGPVATSGCTTRDKLYEDNANRSFLLYLDTSHKQDEAVMLQQRAHSATLSSDKVIKETVSLMKNAQRMLQPVAVINPYAKDLRIPAGVFKQRRSNELYLSLIEAITFYHQAQRDEIIDEKTGEVYIESTLEDIDWANKLAAPVLLRKSDELTVPQRKFYELLKSYLTERNKNSFYSKDIRQVFRMSPSTIKRHVLSLDEYGYLLKVRGSRSKGFEYSLVSFDDYTELQRGIHTILDQALDKLKKKSA